MKINFKDFLVLLVFSLSLCFTVGSFATPYIGKLVNAPTKKYVVDIPTYQISPALSLALGTTEDPEPPGDPNEPMPICSGGSTTCGNGLPPLLCAFCCQGFCQAECVGYYGCDDELGSCVHSGQYCFQ
jgi:hypothetical protein